MRTQKYWSLHSRRLLVEEKNSTPGCMYGREGERERGREGEREGERGGERGGKRVREG